MRSLAAAALIVAAVSLVGCGSRTPAGSSAPQPARPRPQSTAVLAIVAPAPGEHVAGAAVHVRIRLTGATVVPQTSTDLKPDQGHIHLSLDGKVVSMAYGVDQEVAVTPGPHLLTAEFVATDHFPFNPRIVKTVTFDVQ
jgi:hypothetical protein